LTSLGHPCKFQLVSRLGSVTARHSSSGRQPYFHTWCVLSANLRCRSETCCTRLAEYKPTLQDAKTRYLGTVAQVCRPVSSQL